MEDWISELITAVQYMVRVEGDTTRMWSVLAVAALLSIPVFEKVSELLGNVNASKGYAVLMVAVGGAVIVAGVAVTNMYVMEQVPAAYQKWVLPSAVFLLSVAVITPFILFVMKGRFGQALSTWLLTLVAAMAFVFITNSVWDLVTGEKASFTNALGRRDALKKAIDD